jgi:AcrR family transcriptional regulator
MAARYPGLGAPITLMTEAGDVTTLRGGLSGPVSSPGVGIGLRERKKERTRLALEEAALRLFDAHGYDETTVEQIAEAADVSTRTFFRYYPTKADVLLRDQAARLAMVEGFLAARPAGEPVMASLRALLRALAVDMAAERHLLAAQYRWAPSSVMLVAAIRNHHADIVDVVTSFLASRLDGPDPVGGRARAIATACVGSLVSVGTDWVQEKDDGSGAGPDVEAAIAGLESALVLPG